MTSETPGPRDHLLTRQLERRLAGLEPDLRSEEPLDPAEGPARLARHAMKEIGRDLAGVESADDQAQQLNGLLADLGEDASDALLELPPRSSSAVPKAHS
jgi:hypothetical protein